MKCKKRPSNSAFTANAAKQAGHHPPEAGLLFLRLDLTVERGHADSKHGCGLFARTAAMRQGGLDITALLLLNEIVERFADWHRGPGLVGFFTERGGNDVRRQIRRQNHVVL